MLTVVQKQSFYDNGYLIIDDFYHPAELNEFKEAYREVIRASLVRASLDLNQFAGHEFDTGMMALETASHSIVADIYDTVAQIPQFLRIVAKRETNTVINELMGRADSSPLYTFTNRCRIDPPRDSRRTYGWHQEIFYTIPESQFIQTWAPLIRDTTVANGTIEICPGSHKEGIASQAWIESPGRALQIIVDDSLVQKYPAKVVPMRLGQLLLFSGSLFHRSGNNVSQQVRYSLVGMYHNVDKLEFRPPHIDFLHKRKSAKEFYSAEMDRKQKATEPSRSLQINELSSSLESPITT